MPYAADRDFEKINIGGDIGVCVLMSGVCIDTLSFGGKLV